MLVRAIAAVAVLGLGCLPSTSEARPVVGGGLLREQPGAAEVERQWWAGTLKLPAQQGRVDVGIVVAIAPDGAGGWAGSVDLIPGVATAGISALECERVTVTPTAMMLATPQPVPATFTFTRSSPDAETATGEMNIEGMPVLPVSIRRVPEGEARALIVPRPQTPRPPFAYRREAVSITSPADGLTLRGELTLPTGDGPHGAVVLVSDAGEQDRDHADSFHRPFLVIADDLTRRGVAVLRLDDRGVGGSEGVHSDATIDTFAADLRGAVAWLGERGDIDAERIGALGLGNGALVAAVAAVEDPGIAWVVLLSPPGLPGKSLGPLRERRRMEAEGEEADYITAQVDASQRIIDLVVAGEDQEAIAAAIRGAIRGVYEAKRGDGNVPDESQISQVSEQQAFMYTSPANRRWLTLDPAEPLSKLKVPVLAVAGDLDLVVPTGDNFPRVEEALKSAGVEVTAERFASLNHALQPATTGFVDEVGNIQTTIHPTALELIGGWIAARVAPKP